MNRNNPLLPIIIIIPLVLLSRIFSITDLRAEAIQAQQWEITADKLTRFEDPPSIIAEGHVVLEKSETISRKEKTRKKMDWSNLLEEMPGAKSTTEPTDTAEIKTVTTTKVTTTIKADWMVYDMDLGRVKARGNILVDIGPDQLTADKGVINLNQETGTFTNASIIRQYKNMHFEGRVIEKTGDLTYHIEDGWLITCKLKDGETPPWSFGVAEGDIEDNGYAYLKHAVFRIKGIPVLYTPIMVMPVKRTRQTGFLFPTISNSDRDGFDMDFPFFLNLSPNSDVTLYPQYMTKRGFMGGLELRYMLNQESKGGFMVNYLNDELSDINDPNNADYYSGGDYTHTNQVRYWTRGKADQNFGDWITRIDLDIVSDRDYLTEFNSGLTGYTMTQNRFFDVFGRGFQNKTEDERETTLKALRSWGNGMFLQANLRGIDDLRVDKTSPSPLWKLPEINFNGLLPISDTGANVSWETDYVYYWRDKGVKSNRFDLFPRVMWGVPLSEYLETTVTGGIRDTLYLIESNNDPDWIDADSTKNRFLGDFLAEIGTTMIRDFAPSRGSLAGIRHAFRPYANYHYTSYVNKGNLPQFDGVDDAGDQNLVTYGINNLFSLKGKKDDAPYDRDYGYLKIKQGYDIRSSENDTPFTPINIRMAYYPLEKLRFEYRTDIGVYGDNFLKNTVQTNYEDSRGDLFSLNYLYNKNVDNEEDETTSSIKAAASVGLFYYFTAGFSVERSIKDSKTVEENFNLIYHPSCWSVELASNYTPGNQKFTLLFNLANIGHPLALAMPGL